MKSNPVQVKVKNKKELWSSENIGLFRDGTIGICDGGGFVGSLSKDEVEELRKALNKLYTITKHSKGKK